MSRALGIGRLAESQPSACLAITLAIAVALAPALPAAASASPQEGAGEAVAREVVDSRIVEVAVYGAGALVTRRAEIEVDEGVQTIAFPKLPLAMDRSSLRASIPPKSGLRILSVQAGSDFGKVFRKEEAEALDKRVRELEARILDLMDREAIARRTLDHIASIEVTAPASDPPRPPALDPGPWARALAMVREAMGGAYSSLESLAVEQRGVAEQVDELRNEMSRMRGYEASGLARAVVELRAPGKAKVPLTITYFVPAASWVPAYAVRVDQDAGKLTIETSARVAQTTGEDWDGARLLFSTALPTQAASLPKLASWRVRERVAQAMPAPPAPSVAMERAQELATAAMPAAPPPPEEARKRIAAADEEAPMREARAKARRADVPKPAGEAVAPGAAPESLRLNALAGATESKTERGAAGTPEKDAAEFAGWARSKLGALGHIRSHVQAGERSGALPQITAALAPPMERAIESLAEAEGIAPPPPGYLKGLAGGYDYTYEAPGAIPVPSDGEVHAIPLFSDTMNAAFAYVTVPAAIEYVFLSASGKNARDAPLLAGNASIFSGGDFLGRTRLDTLSPGEGFEVSLGVDEEVKVTHHVDEAQQDKGLLGGKRLATVTTEIKLKSFKKKPIEVVVRDRIPFSDDGNLAVQKQTMSPDPEELGDGKGKEGRGIARWKAKLDPGVESEIRFSYTMERPKDTIVSYRERPDMRGTP